MFSLVGVPILGSPRMDAPVQFIATDAAMLKTPEAVLGPISHHPPADNATVQTHSQRWLPLLDAACAQANTHSLHLIIDQSGRRRELLTSVKSVEPALRWHSLFTGLPEEGLLEIAPLLVCVRLDQPLQRLWLESLFDALQGDDQLLALVSHWRFEDLCQHLTGCIDARHNGQSGLLRFFDPRIFALLFDGALTVEQRERWLQPAVLWSWLDFDGVPRRVAGSSVAFDRVPPLEPLELSDEQVGVLACASEAFMAMEPLEPIFPVEWGSEQRFQRCFAALREASEQGLTSTEERHASIHDTLLASIATTTRDRT